MLSCNHNMESDLTQGLGPVRNIYCHVCKAHFYKGREWTKKEWDEYVNSPMDVVAIEIGKTYVDGWGKEHTIGGRTVKNKDWYYTTGGDWFDYLGRKVWYLEGQGNVVRESSLHDLKEEAGPSFFDWGANI